MERAAAFCGHGRSQKSHAEQKPLDSIADLEHDLVGVAQLHGVVEELAEARPIQRFAMVGGGQDNLAKGTRRRLAAAFAPAPPAS